MLAIDWNGATFKLLPERAVYWPARRTLVVADTHFGKAAAFRSHGVPVPETTAADLVRLGGLIDFCCAERLIVLGDFFHAKSGCVAATLQAIEQWRQRRYSLVIDLVRGNHDAHAGDPPVAWRVNCHAEPLVEDGVGFCHRPEAGQARAARRLDGVLAGHVHPCVIGRDVDGSSMRLPCFLFGRRIAILPAFGSFTGNHPMRPQAGERVFGIGGGMVIEMPVVSRARARH